MQFEIGEVLEGKITGITKFGAFVSLPGGQSGLVHISEVANAYVSDIHDFLSVGQTVKVKLIGINDGKLNLSIKKTEPAPKPGFERRSRSAEQPRQSQPRQPQPQPRQVQPQAQESSADKSFEDKLKKFMQESDSKIAGNPIYADRGKSRRRR